MMETDRHLPNADRLSIVAAIIMLAYALTSLITFPQQQASLQLPGFLLELRINSLSVVSLLTAGMAAAGMDWLLQDHPGMKTRKHMPHLLLPALTAWLIGVPLNTMPVSPGWWAVFILGGVFFIFVLLAEYVSVSNTDIYYAPAAMGLIALSFALFLFLAIAVRASAARLYVTLPALVLAAGFASLRSLYLRLGGRLYWEWAAAIALLVGQAAVGLHYLPVRPLQFGLFLAGFAYALTALACGLAEERPAWQKWLEPVLMFFFSVILGVVIG